MPRLPFFHSERSSGRQALALPTSSRAQSTKDSSSQHNQSAKDASGRRAETAWLDGLRGYAALLVFFCHFFFAYYNNVKYAWGTIIPEGTIIPQGTFVTGYGTRVWNGTRIDEGHELLQHNYYLLQLPILRLLLNGDSMVVIFFLVSGYSLSLKPLSLIRKGASAHAQMFTSLSSSIFRRPIRLLLPILVSTLMVAVACMLGLYSYASKVGDNPVIYHRYFLGWAFESTPYIAPTIWGQLVDWWWSMYDLLDFFTHFHWTMTRYDIHLWTIPVELRCSLLLFLTHAALSQMSRRARLGCLAFLAIGGITWGDTWEMSIFWTGMAMCEIDHYWPGNFRKSAIWSAVWVLPFLVGLYFMSMPLEWARLSPPFAPLAAIHIPGMRMSTQSRFWQCIGSTIVLIAISRCRPLKQFFSNSVARYLGRISFALYICHGPINRSLGYSIALKLWELIGRETRAQYNCVVALTVLINFPAVFGVATLFCKFIDEPSIKLARWLEACLKADTTESTARTRETSDRHEREGLMVEAKRDEEQDQVKIEAGYGRS